MSVSIISNRNRTHHRSLIEEGIARHAPNPLPMHWYPLVVLNGCHLMVIAATPSHIVVVRLLVTTGHASRSSSMNAKVTVERSNGIRGTPNPAPASLSLRTDSIGPAPGMIHGREVVGGSGHG